MGYSFVTSKRRLEIHEKHNRIFSLCSFPPSTNDFSLNPKPEQPQEGEEEEEAHEEEAEDEGHRVESILMEEVHEEERDEARLHRSDKVHLLIDVQGFQRDRRGDRMTRIGITVPENTDLGGFRCNGAEHVLIHHNC